ncbi:NAD-binding protein [Streptomyces noursei]|nr:NAD-binding protein [Streptomyces noursei]
MLALAVAESLTTRVPPWHAAYLTLLDLFAINEPALREPLARKLLQLLSGLVGLLLLPVLVAAAFEGLGTFRSASALRRPPRGLSGHVVLLGLGKIGTRVLARLHEMRIPVVCIEADPEARGIALARRLRVPTVVGDVTQEGVLEAALADRARTLLALTSEDTTNLEAALYARSVNPRLRVTLRLFDDGFAAAVYRTLRAAHPGARTRSRSVSFLAAPAFAGAMMGREILGRSRWSGGCCWSPASRCAAMPPWRGGRSARCCGRGGCGCWPWTIPRPTSRRWSPRRVRRDPATGRSRRTWRTSWTTTCCGRRTWCCWRRPGRGWAICCPVGRVRRCAGSERTPRDTPGRRDVHHGIRARGVPCIDGATVYESCRCCGGAAYRMRSRGGLCMVAHSSASTHPGCGWAQTLTKA